MSGARRLVLLPPGRVAALTLCRGLLHALLKIATFMRGWARQL